MKRFLVFCLLLFPLFLSCKTSPVPRQTHVESWNTGGNRQHQVKNRGKVTLLSVSVNRSGGWDSIHNEISGLAPLLLWKHGFCVVSNIQDADFTADVRVHEREYLSKWRSKRSLALEVRIWAVSESDSGKTESVFENQLPLAAGRVISTGNLSLSSSQTMEQLLSLAVKNAAKQIKMYRQVNNE